MSLAPAVGLLGPLDRLAALPAWGRLPLLAALGAVAALGQVPDSVPWAMLAALVVMMALARRGAGFAEGWAFGVGHFGLALRWFVEPFLVEPDRYGWMAPFAMAMVAGGFALFWGAAFGLARRLRLGPLGLVALWAGAEALRSLILTGFPWALVGHVWIGTPIEQGVAWVGAHGLTLLTLLLAAWVVRLGPTPWLGLPAAATAAAWLVLDPGPAPPPDPEAPLVRLVQPNVPQAEKWDPERMPGHLVRLMRLSSSPEGAAPADLVVWPETALTELLDPASPTLAVAHGAADRAPLVFGVARAEGERYFNALAVMDGQGTVTGTYDKAHLVPFGEYVPWGDLLGRIGIRGMAQAQGDGFSPGPGPALIEVPGLGRVRPLICYEGIFAEEIAAGAERPRALLLVTNDAWFGRRAGPLQHFALGRLRAIETGLPLLRAANTGVSAVIDGRGRVLAALPLHEAGALEARLPAMEAVPLYARTGDLPALLAILALLGASAARRSRALDLRAPPA